MSQSKSKLARALETIADLRRQLKEKAGTPSATWVAAGEPDPHRDRYNCERADLTLGDLTDDQLANGAFMNYDRPLDIHAVLSKQPGYHSPIAWMTAVKDRLRWLSRKLEQANAENEQLRLQLGGMQMDVDESKQWEKRACTEATRVVELEQLIKRIVGHAKRDRDNERHGAPNHCHRVRNHWDADGSLCQECVDWDQLRAVADEQPDLGHLQVGSETGVCQRCGGSGSDGGWIPLAESTPPDGVPVLRWPGWAAEISIDEWCNDHGCFLMSIEEGERATHWKPISAPAAIDAKGE